jgi:hypothetical protein
MNKELVQNCLSLIFKLNLFMNYRYISYTVKPVYLKHVDKLFLKLDLYYFNEYVFKNHLSTYLR